MHGFDYAEAILMLVHAERKRSHGNTVLTGQRPDTVKTTGLSKPSSVVFPLLNVSWLGASR